MASKQIGLAKQDGNSVKVYDTNGSYLFSRPGILVGFTSETVAIQRGNHVDVYDANGSLKYTR